MTQLVISLHYLCVCSSMALVKEMNVFHIHLHQHTAGGDKHQEQAFVPQALELVFDIVKETVSASSCLWRLVPAIAIRFSNINVSAPYLSVKCVIYILNVGFQAHFISYSWPCACMFLNLLSIFIFLLKLWYIYTHKTYGLNIPLKIELRFQPSRPLRRYVMWGQSDCMQ